MPEHIINFNDVTKKYLVQVALKNVSFTLPYGKIIGLVGPNGSGKSTIIKLIAGLARPSSGSVTVNGKEANRMLASEVAYLCESDFLYPFFTVGETMDFYAGMFADFDPGKAREILNFMQLEPDKKVKNLSKGNRGRLKILLVLARKAPLVLLDEPLSGLDPLVRESIIKSLLSNVDLGSQTIIMSTHEVAEVEPILDSVVAVQNGEVRGITEVDIIRKMHGQSLVEWIKQIMAR